MQVFRAPGGIERLSTEARIVYKSFCVFLLLGYATSAWFYLDDDFGLTPGGTRAYYLGDEVGEPEELAAGGPQIDLPDLGASPEPLRLEKPARQVIETH